MNKALKLTVIFLITFSIFSCSERKKEKRTPFTEKEKLTFRIDSLNAVITDLIKKGEIDIKTTMYIVQAYEYYAHDYPNDKMSGAYLMKSGELYENILQDKQRAIRRYQSAFLHKRKFATQPMALFRSANLYDDLGDTTKAIETYNLFMEKYPKHDFANQAKGMISIIRMGGVNQFLEEKKRNNICF